MLIRISLVNLLFFCLTFTLFSKEASAVEQPLIFDHSGIENAAAHWLKPTILAISPQYTSPQLTLITENEQHFSLTPCQLSNTLAEKYPHLAHFNCFQVMLNAEDAKQLIKRPLAVMTNNNGERQGTYVQTSALIDDLFTSGVNDADEITDLGARITQQGTAFKLWAPTAMKVAVQLFDKNKRPLATGYLSMSEDPTTGVWSASTTANLDQKYYRYQVTLYHPSTQRIETLTTTDPYSLSLSTNSEYSQIVDLNSPSTQPAGWLAQQDNPVLHPEDNIFYETHIRDFSANDNSLSNLAYRGKYLAFTEKQSDGIKHLTALKAAGINSIHLLPTFDIGTINENAEKAIDINDSLSDICKKSQLPELCKLAKNNQQQSLAAYLASLDSLSEQQQAIMSAIRALDNYNWGYDPFHYTVPEGSYAVNPEGISRIKEFRLMVQTLHNMGFRVIMDVVYNHTHQASLEPTAVLDKIVPNYYQRLDTITGEIAQSTCCDNTATEHVMMEKLMIDSLVVWARDYKIDGFRFDLMGHQPKAAMLRAREAVYTVDADNYFYGEGWNFGEVANNQRFVQASQLELGGTEIGTFTDRLRDAVRGGAFNAQGDDIRKSQGIANGLATLPNELQTGDNIERYLALADQLRIGLAGNLAHFSLTTANDNSKLGKEISYGGQPAGYALDPADTINYVSKHDNQTLWDNNQYRVAYHLSTEQRVRMQLLALAYPLFAQGIPFIHMGSELLRSKGFLRDSYDYGDWFNKVDFAKQTNNYAIGLPPAEKDQQNWSTILTLRNKNAGKDIATANDIAFSNAVFLELVKIRMSTPQFRLTTAQAVIENVKFHNTGSKQTIGLIAMSIKADEANPELMVIFNNTGSSQTLPFDDAAAYQLHPIQQQGIDDIVKTSQANNKHFTVPGLTTAVFVKH